MLRSLGSIRRHDDAAEDSLESIRSSWPWALLVAVTTAYICVPFLKAVFWLGDEGIFLSAWQRLSIGQHLYRDVFEVIPPLSLLVTSAWMSTMGASLVSARILSSLVFVITSVVTFDSCRRLSGNAALSALAVMFCALLSQGVGIELGHHWFTTMFGSVALNLSLRPRTTGWRLWSIGGLVGAAVMTTTNRGLLIFTASLISNTSLRSFRSFLLFMIGTSIIPFIMLVYVVLTGALSWSVKDVIVFPLNRYSHVQGLSFGYAADAQNWLLVYLIPMTIFCGALRAAYERNISLYNPATTAMIYAVAALLGCFPRPDMPHILPNIPLALPSLLATIGGVRVKKEIGFVLLFLLGLAVRPAMDAYTTLAQSVRNVPKTRTRAGLVRFVNARGEAALIARLGRMPADQKIMFYPYMPMMAFLTGRPQLGRIDEFVPDYTTPQQYREACIIVMTKASWIVIDRRWLRRDFLMQTFPGLPDAEPVERMMFERALARGFLPAGSYGVYELRKRDAADTSLCDGLPLLPSNA